MVCDLKIQDDKRIKLWTYDGHWDKVTIFKYSHSEVQKWGTSIPYTYLVIYRLNPFNVSILSVDSTIPFSNRSDSISRWTMYGRVDELWPCNACDFEVHRFIRTMPYPVACHVFLREACSPLEHWLVHSPSGCLKNCSTNQSYHVGLGSRYEQVWTMLWNSWK